MGGGLIPTQTSSNEKGKQDQKRTIPQSLRPLVKMLERVFTGQLVDQPNTAISVPLQQAISNAQGGFGGMAQNLGVGGMGALGPGPNQAGLQSREQLGLPDRKSYMGAFLPTAEQVAALGSVPSIPSTKGGKKAVKRAKAGKPTPRQPQMGYQ